MANKKYNQFTAGTPAGTDLVLYGNPTTGLLKSVTLDNLNTAVGIIRRVKITKTFADFAAAAPINTISAGFDLPAKGIIHDVFIDPRITFSGGALGNYSISLGKSAFTAFFTALKGVFTGAPFAWAGPSSPMANSMNALTSILLTANTGATGDLNLATQGEVDIWIYYSVLN